MNKARKIKNSTEPVSIKRTKKILNQLMNCIFQIKINGKNGTGFFCLIPFRKKSFKVLMTNYQVLNEKDLKENKKIDLLLNNRKDALTIDLGIKREIYFNKDYDITIIELSEEDKIKDYLELDDNLFQDYSELIYKDQSVYVLQYLNDNPYVSYGLLNIKYKHNIIHKCNIDECSSGSPILNLQNNKLIGIHTQNSNNLNYNTGTLLKFPIKEFINQKILSMNKRIITIKNIEYEIVKELGKDGFGRIYQVLSGRDNKYYAINEIQIKEETKEQIESFQNEIDILSKFNSNNIVKYYDSYQDNKKLYIIMEFCDWNNLRSFLDKYKKNNTLINEHILNNIIKQICIGIKEIHNKKIIHRDLIPENIFINEKMEIKIGNFGISKQLNSYKTHALIINKPGSDNYIAPEIKSKGICDEKSDIWSLGYIIYELFTLSIYSKNIKKVDSNESNNKWQELIDSLLQGDYTKRFDINQVNKFLEEKLNIIINNKDNKDNKQIEQKRNEINNMNINNKIQNINLNINNKIIGEIYINKNNIDENIQIINSFENVKRKCNWKENDDDWKYENEKEIKNNVIIKINGIIIEFNYYYKFDKEGKYKIEYLFKNNLTKTCYMFYNCKALTNLNLSNFNTEKVTNMSHMFEYCESLTNLNLSNFNTQNVNDMSDMFACCNSLTNLNLSNFNTQNVNDMSSMLSCCNSLTNVNLSNFNTQKVTNMLYMFACCNSLTYLNLSNFNTQKVNDMSGMFSCCNSLTNLNLSNFNTQNVNDMSGMFDSCYSLKKENIITQDNKILKLF